MEWSRSRNDHRLSQRCDGIAWVPAVIGKVLLIAEQANPEWVSVPLVGWSLAAAIAARIPCLIVTHPRNGDAFLRAGLMKDRDFVTVDNEHIAAPLHKASRILRGGEGKGWTAVTALESLAYYEFERQLWMQLGERIQRREFSLVHRITPLSPTAPSIIATRCQRAGVPFIVGPLNGGLPWPKGFEGRRIAEREWLSYVRALYKLLPGYRGMREAASCLIVASEATRSQLAPSYRSKSYFMPENGVPASAIVPTKSRVAALPLRILFVGRFVPYKCPDLLIRAAEPLIRNRLVKLVFVGGGPMEQSLQKLSSELGLSGSIEFKGWMPRELVLEEMANSDLLALPSIREFGGGVVLEAMARGLPSVVANYGGPAELVDESTGFRFDFDSEVTLQSSLRLALETAVRQPDRLSEMSINCLRNARERHTWDAKAEAVVRLYEHVLLRGTYVSK